MGLTNVGISWQIVGNELNVLLDVLLDMLFDVLWSGGLATSINSNDWCGWCRSL